MMSGRATKSLPVEDGLKKVHQALGLAHFSFNSSNSNLLHREADCACGGTCPTCDKNSASNLQTNQNDSNKPEADGINKQVTQSNAGQFLTNSIGQSSTSLQAGIIQRKQDSDVESKNMSSETASTQTVSDDVSESGAEGGESQESITREQTRGDEETANGSPEELQGRQCCSPDEITRQPFSFDVEEEEPLREMCTPTGCVSLTINARWASPHRARHYRVIMHVFDTPTTGRDIVRRFDAGRTETQRFNIGRCKEFTILIQVISPSTSPKLIVNGVANGVASGC